jgi:hypothetical protein
MRRTTWCRRRAGRSRGSLRTPRRFRTMKSAASDWRRVLISGCDRNAIHSAGSYQATSSSGLALRHRTLGVPPRAPKSGPIMVRSGHDGRAGTRRRSTLTAACAPTVLCKTGVSPCDPRAIAGGQRGSGTDPRSAMWPFEGGGIEPSTFGFQAELHRLADCSPLQTATPRR